MLTKEQIQARINELYETRGITLISEFTKVHDKHTFKCDKGHIWITMWNNVYNSEQGCPFCSGKRIDNIKERIRELYEKRGITLISEFTKALDKCTFKCDKGHTWIATWNSVYNGGSGCPFCGGKRIDNITERIRELYEKRGIMLVSAFTKVHDKHTFRCSEGHIWVTTWADVYNQGYGCPACCGHRIDDIQSRINELYEKRGITLISEFTRVTDKHTFKCSKGHTWVAKWVSVYNQEKGCPSCHPQYSKGEKAMSGAIARICKGLGLPAPQENVRGVIGGRLEIDCYIPSLSLGFEYDGAYWHERDDAQERDARKDRNADYYGIQLIRVQERDWLRDPGAVIHAIDNAIRARLSLPLKPSRWEFTGSVVTLPDFTAETLLLF
jgi:hypothetical protein